jgi:acetoin utilization protein AcuB
MIAREIMQSPVEDVMPFDDINHAFAKMRRCGVHHLPVVNTKSEVVGILSDRDILRGLAEVANSDAPMPVVSSWMKTDVITCRADEPLESVIHKLLEHRINCLPVVDMDARCIGMITSRDVIRTNLNRLQAADPTTMSAEFVEL